MSYQEHFFSGNILKRRSWTTHIAMKAQWKDRKLFLARQTIEKLKAEYLSLKEGKLPQIRERITRVREEGGEDIFSVLATISLEEQMVEGRVEEIEKILSCARQLKKNGEKGKVHLGSKVRVGINGKTLTLQIVESVEANPLESKISCESPVGQALLGAKIGQEIEVAISDGRLAYKVLGVF